MYDVRLKKLLKPFIRLVPNSRLRIIMLRLCGYSIGKDAFIGEDIIISDNIHDRNVYIGDRVSLAPRVTLVTSSGPNNSKIRPYVRVVDGPVNIKSDAWIGTGAIILPNVTVGEGAVIGAGAVVLKDVPPYTVVVGVPAREVRRIK